MKIGNKQILVVGDRVLIKPENNDERTKVGLYVPQTVIEKEPVQSGRVVAKGPGIAYPTGSGEGSEPWQETSDSHHLKFIPVQAEVGDFALFLKKEAFEIQYQKETYLVVPQGAILLLIRDEEEHLSFDSEIPDLLE
ncbi:MAG: co-chaperone GroES [Candidatus Omnitrophica bacterium]|nr:co-chaperone GroES [Candidatus Omnitrophota bacterium]MCA9432568.1 co-chaperone GroES [Candidatus Omnitrophota bacterium]MCB9783996.1 co-chaperone GroES [Candidatus Omnitrophota bacterium]